MKKVYLALVLTFCLVAFNFGQTPTPTPKQPAGIGTGSGVGNPSGSDNGGGELNPPPPPKPLPGGKITPLLILFKPSAVYTPEARENGVQGAVTVRVIFNASGQIGSIATVSGLPDGLTEQAVKAAKQIKFEPQKRGDIAYSVSKTIQYNFAIDETYRSEDDKSLKKKARILEMPRPELLPDEIESLGGRVKVSVLLNLQGGASLFRPNSAWSKELKQKIREAVAKIKFNPAIDQTDAAITQLKEIEYVFPKKN